MTATDPLNPANKPAHECLRVLAEHVGTDDQRVAWRAVRAWLHLVRDRLTVDAAVHIGAQLPEDGVRGDQPLPAGVYGDSDRRLDLLEQELSTALEAVTTLASDLADHPTEEPDPHRAAHAAEQSLPSRAEQGT